MKTKFYTLSNLSSTDEVGRKKFISIVADMNQKR